ncbi:MAG: hypothetical protein KDE59_33450, partial [Anaerolineales bacterium]|nr:hypothetical protein [Anaerolineales bacterium]
MADAVARAAAFVRAQGDALAQARLAWLLAGQPVPDALLTELLAGQRADGGYAPFWAPASSSVDATCYRLAQVLQVGGGLERPEVGRATEFLHYRQAPGGFWQEAETLAELAPPWAAPGDLAATLYLTANTSFLLASLGATAELNRAAAWLAQ